MEGGGEGGRRRKSIYKKSLSGLLIRILDFKSDLY
jgi:hypothetical protein